MQASLPLVSVIIPCYNHQDYILDSIKSVIAQTYKNIELIIIDDGSKDNSVDAIKQLEQVCQQRFCRFEFRARPNKGLSATLNEGMNWAKGEYFCALASDDMMVAHKIELQVAYMLDNPDVTSVFGGINLVDEYGITRQQRINDHKYFSFEDIFLHEHELPAPTQMHKLRDILELGGFSQETKIEDWEILLRITKSGKKVVYIPELLSLYRIHGDNTFTKNELMLVELCKIINFYKDHPLFEVAKYRIIKIYRLKPLKKVNKLKYYWLKLIYYFNYKVHQTIK